MKRAFVIIFVVFLVLQVIRPEKVPYKVDESKALHPPKKVETILEKACYDCHSDRVRYPWYANIAPISWTIAHHIEEGRKALNFSRWSDIPKDVKGKKLDRAVHMVDIGIMPLPTYKLIHKDAVLSKKEKGILRNYFESLRSNL